MAKIAESSSCFGFNDKKTIIQESEKIYLNHEKLVEDFNEILELTMRKPKDTKLEMLLEV